MKLIDVFPNWETNGIFNAFDTLNVPWKTSATPINLNIAYYGNHSGNKTISPLIEKYISNGELSSESVTKIVNSMFAIYNENWVKLWETLSFEYNPIENYRMTETATGTYNRTGTINNTNESNGTSNLNNNGSVYGFNSSESVPINEQSGQGETELNTTNLETRNLTDAENKNLTRSGNIGVTTSQQMIESERDLWQWFFFDSVFRDIDKFLVLQIY